MKKIYIPSSSEIIAINKLVCVEGGNPHHCYDIGKVESAVHSAFYPGTYPFVAGGLAHVAGALCFYLVKSHAFMDGNKRTGSLSAVVFLNTNGWDLQYPAGSENEKSALGEIIEKCAAGEITKEELMTWFDVHKIEL